MFKDKFQSWYSNADEDKDSKYVIIIKNIINSLVCFYCWCLWGYLIPSIYNNGIFKADYLMAAKIGFIAFWYIKLQEFLIRKINKK